MKFIHAADLHLDSPLIGLDRYEGAPVDRIRGATRLALQRMIDIAIDEMVDFVLIAGDVYDGNWKDFNTGLFFSMQMHRLREADIKVYLVRGNHDAANRMTMTLNLPDNVRSFSHKEPQTIFDEELGIAIHGQSYAKGAVTDNLATNYGDTQSGFLNIGLLHTNVGGFSAHENYAPCSLSDLVNKGYQYWALGHVHQNQILNECPWVVYSGNTQGRHIREEGPKGCLLVNVNNCVIDDLDFRQLDNVRWKQCHVAIDTAVSPEEAIVLVLEAVELLLGELTGELLVVRIILEGHSKAHVGLVKDQERWRNEIRGQLFQFQDNVWLESVKFDSRKSIDLESILKREDALGDLFRLINNVSADSELIQKFRQEMIEPLAAKLPLELRSTHGIEIVTSELERHIANAKIILHQKLL